MNSFIESYFSEKEVFNSDAIIRSIKIGKHLFSKRSKYQQIDIFQSPALGTCFSLDGAMQCTELDEFAYQEMIAFLPLNSHPDPKKVLIIGGGDGGVVREVVKHPLVEEVVLCEIDESVIEASKTYLPFMSQALNNSKVKIIIEDGVKFVENHKNCFDVIITDSSDPDGPAEGLFNEAYFLNAYHCLKTGGIICSQSESIWFHFPFIKSLYKIYCNIFKSVAYSSIMVPTYPSGQIGFMIACKDKPIQFTEPLYKFSFKQQESMNLRYYSESIHKSAFILPAFVEKELKAIAKSVTENHFSTKGT